MARYFYYSSKSSPRRVNNRGRFRRRFVRFVYSGFISLVSYESRALFPNVNVSEHKSVQRAFADLCGERKTVRPFLRRHRVVHSSGARENVEPGPNSRFLCSDGDIGFHGRNQVREEGARRESGGNSVSARTLRV